MNTLRQVSRWLDQDLMRAPRIYMAIAFLAIAMPKVFGLTGVVVGAILAVVQAWFWARMISHEEFGWEILLDMLENRE